MVATEKNMVSLARAGTADVLGLRCGRVVGVAIIIIGDKMKLP